MQNKMKQTQLEKQLANKTTCKNYLDKCIAQLWAGQNPEAIKMLQQYLCVFPSDGEAHYYLGNAFFNARDLDKAIHHLRRALALRNDKTQILFIIAYVAYEQGNLQIGCDALEMVVAMEPDNQCALSCLGSFLVTMGQRLGLAIDCLRKAVQLESYDQGAWYYLGMALITQGNIAEAVQAYERVIEIDSDSRHANNARCRLAEVHLN